MNHLTKQITPKRIFFLFSACFTLLSLACLVLMEGQLKFSDKIGYGSDSYMDFFNHIAYTQYPEKVYDVSIHACFPPLAYLMYRLLFRVLPENAILMEINQISVDAMLMFVVYSAAAAVIVYCAVEEYLKKSPKAEQIFAFFSILISNGFIFGAIERGNSAQLVLALLILAMAFRDSESPILRETAMILIAVSAGFKVYPCIFGLLYIREGKWKEAARLIVYGIVFFFVPFAFFGGFPSILKFFSNQAAVHDLLRSGEIYSIYSLMTFLFQAAAGVKKLAIVAAAVIFLLAFFLLPLKKWEQYLILSVAMILLPIWSGPYTQIYMAIPLLAMLKEEDPAPEKPDWAYLTACGVHALFAVVFSLTVFLEPIAGMRNGSRFADYLAIYALLGIVLLSGAVRKAAAKAAGK